MMFFEPAIRTQNIVNVFSYSNLSSLYGPDQKIQNSIRAFKDGLLKPDVFAEVRIITQPPEVCA
jgi:linoleate 10R-lipoxygenase